MDVDGLVHVTELSHERNVSPKSVVSVGDEVEVKVLAIDEEAGRVITFHLKQQHLDHGMVLNKSLLLVMLSKVKLNA